MLQYYKAKIMLLNKELMQLIQYQVIWNRRTLQISWAWGSIKSLIKWMYFYHFENTFDGREGKFSIYTSSYVTNSNASYGSWNKETWERATLSSLGKNFTHCPINVLLNKCNTIPFHVTLWDPIKIMGME